MLKIESELVGFYANDRRFNAEDSDCKTVISGFYVEDAEWICRFLD